MGKSLYSVMLMDEVVREIDRQALQQNTNRSNLINQILAEYVSFTTPEMRISSIFKTIEDFINGCEADIIPYVAPHQSTMSLKSSLEYRYRPTIKYDVELYREPTGGAIGQLSVVFRTQSPSLLEAMNRFFALWVQVEKKYTGGDVHYALYEGRFIRSLTVSQNKNYTSRQIADAISNYIRLFDAGIKGYLSGRYNEKDIEKMYRDYYRKGEDEYDG